MRHLRLHSQRVDVPTYDRSTLQRGVVHIGAGNFHRAHQAVYFDDLARSGISDQWGVTGVSLRSRDVKDLLSAQDGLYTVVQRGHDRQTARVVGSIGSVHYAPNDGAAVRAALADPQTRIVSLTITGNGYFLNPVTDEFDAEPPRRACRPRRLRQLCHRVGVSGRSARPASPRRHRAVHRALLRQHSRRHPGGADRAGVVRRLEGPRAGPLDRRLCRVPVDHGRPHHPSDLEVGAQIRRAGHSASPTNGRS